MTYRLGVDLGTTSVAAAVSVDGRPAQVIMLGSRPQLASTLFVTEDGNVQVGDEAVARAAATPARAVPDPLRRLADDLPAFDDGTQHVSGETGVATLLAAALRASTASQGGSPTGTVLSHPAGWDDYQRSCLLRAAAEAGLPECSVVADIEAAARSVVARADPGTGARFLIMDLGGGSCTVGVAARTAEGVDVLAYEHADHPSGNDFDEAVFRLVGGNLGDQGRALTKDDPDSRARAVEVRQACRDAKEILSSAPEASVTVGLPGFSKTIRIGRGEFESLVRPSLRDAIGLANRMLPRASVTPKQLMGVALVGGASRMPVVAELVQREWDLPVVLGPTPELDVAEGLVTPPLTVGSAGTAPVTSVPVPVPVQLPGPVPDPAPESMPVPEVEPADDTPVPVSPEAVAPPPVMVAPVVDVPAPVASDPAGRPPGDDDTLPGLSSDATTDPLTLAAAPVNPPPPPATTAPGPPAAASTTEQPMPEHMIFDYFSAATTEPIPVVPTGSAAAVSPRSPRILASAPTPPRPPGQRPGAPGQRPVPPGQRPGSAGQRPGPATQPYGSGGGRGPGGPGGYPPQSGGGGPLGSRRNLILAIVGGVVLVAAAIGIGFWLARPDPSVVTGTPSGQITAPPATDTPIPTPTALPSGSTTPGATPNQTPSGGASTPTGGGSASTGPLPAGPPLAQNLVVVPMRTDDDEDDERPLYLVDANGGADPVRLDEPNGNLANPMLQKDRTSIIFLEGGVLHVMASDGNGERDLTDREPAGCDNVTGASWSPADASTMVISCRLSKDNHRMLVVDTNGRLIRRLDAGEQRFDDVTISPDGQTVLYWASDSETGDGGSLYTLPLVGTGAPKKITSGAKGLDGDPSWSPDGSQISFRRLVGGADGNADVYVMNADGSGQRAVADTKASDVKPVWSPDGKNLLVVSNRKSAFGSAGKTWDLWLTRVSDGEVLNNFDLEAATVTTPTWTYR